MNLEDEIWNVLRTGTSEERASLLRLIEKYAGPEKRAAVEAVLDSERSEEWKSGQ